MNASADFASIWIVEWRGQIQSEVRLTPQHLAALDTTDPKNILKIDELNLLTTSRPPYPTGPQCLVITFEANILAACHEALRWPVPERIIDLSVEFRNASNGARRPCGDGFIGARVWYGLSAAGGLDIGCSSDDSDPKLAAVLELFEAMRPELDLGRALLRGRYMCAVARIENHGVPIDSEKLEPLCKCWPAILESVVQQTDEHFGVFRMGRFQPDLFAHWLHQRRREWPRVDGKLDLREATFREMARVYPETRPLKELITTLQSFHPGTLAVGTDGRNRVPLRPFTSRTGRNQPSSKASILGSAAWVRNFVRPAHGKALALIDWSQQEFGIAAALSEDGAMWAAYESGDPYLALAVKAGAAPNDATISTHSRVREQFKSCALGVQYGIGSETLARLGKISESEARHLISSHKISFPTFWRWSEAVENEAQLKRRLASVFGWQVHVDEGTNPRFVRNFPMQANGAEMLRLACCLVTERGMQVCATLHDAMLIEASDTEILHAVDVVQHAMSEASRIVLEGFALRSAVRLIRHPESLGDARGAAIWTQVERAIQEMDPSASHPQPARERNGTRAAAHTRTIYLYDSKEDQANASD